MKIRKGVEKEWGLPHSIPPTKYNQLISPLLWKEWSVLDKLQSLQCGAMEGRMECVGVSPFLLKFVFDNFWLIKSLAQIVNNIWYDIGQVWAHKSNTYCVIIYPKFNTINYIDYRCYIAAIIFTMIFISILQTFISIYTLFLYRYHGFATVTSVW